jgi:hypothetical protein
MSPKQDRWERCGKGKHLHGSVWDCSQHRKILPEHQRASGLADVTLGYFTTCDEGDADQFFKLIRVPFITSSALLPLSCSFGCLWLPE